MKNFICYLIVLAAFGFFQKNQAQEVENPQEELVKAWYLDKLVIDQQDYFFVPDESVQNVVIDFGHYEASEDEEETGGFRTRFCEDTFALYLIENDQELYTFSWTWLASATETPLCGLDPITDDRVSDVRYLYEFWMYEDYEPFHYTYSIQQVEMIFKN